MKTTLAALLALGLLTSTASARTYFDDLRDTAPHTVFDDLRDTAPRSPFDQLGDTAPRSIFDDIRDTAPRSDNVFGDLEVTAP